MYKENGCEISDASLARTGQDKINWVIPAMPVLNAIKRRFEAQKPLSGLNISVSIHLEAKTAYFAHVLRSGGANVFITGCNPLSTQNDVAAALVSDGFTVNAVHGASPEDYNRHLMSTLACVPDIFVDDGGDLLEILHSSHPDLARNIIAGCEETTTGVCRMRARAAAGELRFPMLAVNDAKSKHLFDNRYGTGQSVWDAIMHTTNLMVTGKTVVIAGYGYCGRGVAKNAKGIGANVIVTEVDAHAALEAVMDGHRVMPMAKAALLGDIFITVTGCKDIITAEHFSLMKDNAILCNAGHFDVEVDVRALEKLALGTFDRKPGIRGYTLSNGRTLNVLAEGRLVNLAAGNGHPAEIMDMSFGLQSLCVEYIAKNGSALKKNEVSEVPFGLDGQVAEIKLESLGAGLDVLTSAQRAYISGWEV